MRKLKTISYILLSIAIIFIFSYCSKPDPTSPASQARLTLTANPSEIPADGESTSTITAYVLNPDGTPATGVPIVFTTTCGYISTESGTVSDGVATATLTSTNFPCEAVVTVEVIQIKKSITVKFYPIRAAKIDLTASAYEVPIDSTVIISAFVYNEEDRPVPDGRVVYFTTTFGQLNPESTETKNGTASTVFTASQRGTFMVQATCDGVTSNPVFITFY